MDSSNNLSFSSEFNYRKILLDENVVVSVPGTAAYPAYNTVLTVDTTLIYVPTAEVNYEYLGNLGYGGFTGPSNLGVWFELVGTTYSLKVGFIGDTTTYNNVTIYYRVYLDGSA